MTVVMNRLPQDHLTRMAENDHYMAADPDSKRILYFDRLTLDDNVMNIPMVSFPSSNIFIFVIRFISGCSKNY